MPLKYDLALREAYSKLVTNPDIYNLPLEQGVNIIVKECARILKVSFAGVWLFSDDQSSLVCFTSYDVSSGQYSQGDKLAASDFPVYFDALLKYKTLDVDDTFNDPRTKELVEPYLVPHDVKSLLDSSILHNGKVRGVLCMEMVGEVKQWTDAEEEFASFLSEIVAKLLILSELTRSEARHKAMFEGASEGICIFANGYFVDANPAANRLFGATSTSLIGKSAKDISPEYQNDGELSSVKAERYFSLCMEQGTLSFEWQCIRLDGTVFDAEVTLNKIHVTGDETLFALIRDITERKQIERQARLAMDALEYRVAHDSLTGLRNVDNLHIYLAELISDIQDSGEKSEVAFVLFDLKRFKEINDTLGHHTGDKVLKLFSEKISKPIAQSGGELFRVGGDEFVVVFTTEHSSVDFEELELAMQTCLKTTISIDEVTIELSANFGMSKFPANGQDSYELMRCADVAMYHAKHNDGTSCWYDQANDVNDKRRLAMMVELGTAIREDQFILHYQPKIDIKTGKVNGCEALIRWQHPKHGLVFPGEFLPIAEMSDFIHPLSDLVLKHAVLQIKDFLKNGYAIPIAVNISARNLVDSHLVDAIESLLGRYNIEPYLLEIEITESALITHPQRALDNLKKLDRLGISIAIDDFGTGYSSLSYLTKLPLDTLKIDRSFVNEMLSSEFDSMIVASTISLAHNLSLKVVAEGVEDLATMDALAAMHCDQAQGYHIAKPLPVETFKSWLQERR